MRFIFKDIQVKGEEKILGCQEVTKIKINELRKLLDTLISSDGIDNKHILKISKELDKLILEFYLEGHNFFDKE